MSFIELIAEPVITTLIEKLVSTAIEKIFEELRPGTQSVETRLDNIQKILEMNQATHLKAALSFLRLGELEKARDAFIHAEASDRLGAVARLYLSILFTKEGKVDLARERLKVALGINPFIIKFTEPLQLSADNNPPHALTPARSWSRQLNSKSFVNSVPRPKNTLLRLLKGQGKYGAISTVSCSGGDIAVSWRLGNDFLEPPDDGGRIISMINLTNGSCVWTTTVTDSELFFATPNHVVLKSSKSPAKYFFLSMSNGEMQREVSPEYFETIFCPSANEVRQSDEFKRSNQMMPTSASIKVHKERYTAIEYKKKNFLQKWFWPTVEYKYESAAVLTDPFDLGIFRIRASNKWSNYFKPTMAGRKVLYEELLYSDALISRVS
ncbi:MAG: tetratricopeptide repeat protein [Acidobacteria bacterium]|nr:tetratricopeptide repeat protein [Acidobacteriota bacterium]